MLCDGELEPEKAGLGNCTGAGFNRFVGGPGPISK